MQSSTNLLAQLIGTVASDRLRGRRGNDFLDGMSGDDRLFGRRGNDLLWGNDGNDFLSGGKGDDVVVGREGNDNVRGGAGDDVVIGTDGADQITGGKGYDVLVGDTPFAPAESDRFRITSGKQTDVIVDFQVGLDVLDFSSNVNTDNLKLSVLANNTVVQTADTGEVLTILRGVEATTLADLNPVDGSTSIATPSPGGLTDVNVVTGTNNADTLAGGDQTNILDFINGGSGDDILSDTAPGFSVINGDRGNDRLTGGPSVNILNGGKGNDQLVGADNAVPGASAEARRYLADYLFGGAGNDELNGLGGDDVLVGGGRRDTLNGGAGNDILIGGRGRDRFWIADETGTDIIVDFKDGRDRLLLDDTLSVGQLSINQGDGYTEIGVSGSDRTLAFLVNVQADQITAADFV